MALALRSSNLLKALVSIDNAPVRAALKSNFSYYIEGLRQVEKAKVMRQSEAEEILEKFETVGLCMVPFFYGSARNLCDPTQYNRIYPYDDFCLQTLSETRQRAIFVCGYLSRSSPQI